MTFGRLTALHPRDRKPKPDPVQVTTIKIIEVSSRFGTECDVYIMQIGYLSLSTIKK